MIKKLVKKYDMAMECLDRIKFLEVLLEEFDLCKLSSLQKIKNVIEDECIDIRKRVKEIANGKD